MKKRNICIVLVIFAILQQSIAETNDELFSWFSQHPATDDTFLEERQRRTDILDEYSNKISTKEWYDMWFFGKKEIITLQPILSYLKYSEEYALAEIKRTKVTDGVRIWKFYNMGMIVKTPETCFGIDLLLSRRDYAKYIELIDFLIVSHPHEDHADGSLMIRMSEQKKPIFAILVPSKDIIATRITDNTVVDLPGAKIRFIVSSQFKPGERLFTPCLISIIECTGRGNGVTIMHPGDADKYEDIPKDLSIDYMVIRNQSWWTENIETLLDGNEISIMNIDHKLELGHNPNQELYKANYVIFEKYKTKEIISLTWGESISLNNHLK